MSRVCLPSGQLARRIGGGGCPRPSWLCELVSQGARGGSAAEVGFMTRAIVISPVVGPLRVSRHTWRPRALSASCPFASIRMWLLCLPLVHNHHLVAVKPCVGGASEAVLGGPQVAPRLPSSGQAQRRSGPAMPRYVGGGWVRHSAGYCAETGCMRCDACGLALFSFIC